MSNNNINFFEVIFRSQILIANKFALVTLTASYRVSKFLKVILLNVSADRNGTELGSPRAQMYITYQGP
jgi:hypothetical protein